MSTSSTVDLGGRFARELPELAVPWKAESADEPLLLALNDTLATELGLRPDWLRAPDGLRFLVGNLVPESATPVAQACRHQFGGFCPAVGRRPGAAARRVDGHGRGAAGSASEGSGLRPSPAVATGWLRSG